MHCSRDWSCTDHVTDHAPITWLIMHWSRNWSGTYHLPDHALITWLIIHWSRDWSCTDHIIDPALITWLIKAAMDFCECLCVAICFSVLFSFCILCIPILFDFLQLQRAMLWNGQTYINLAINTIVFENFTAFPVSIMETQRVITSKKEFYFIFS